MALRRPVADTTDGLPGPESGALARISPDDEKVGNTVWGNAIGRGAGSADRLAVVGETGLIHRTGEAFTRDIELVRKATGYKKSRRPTGSRVAGHASRVSRHHSTVSVTHRFL